ncbi:MAG: hypothetical protein HRU21_01065 [Pseudomonadales bacterium]|nr:hypothetical protein [Pseudomonadales bacterium]
MQFFPRLQACHGKPEQGFAKHVYRNSCRFAGATMLMAYCSVIFATDMVFPQLASLFENHQHVQVHEVDDKQIMLSWQSQHPRKLAPHTVEIFQDISHHLNQQQHSIYVAVGVSPTAALEGVDQRNSRFKANYIRKVLQQYCVSPCSVEVEAIGAVLKQNVILFSLQDRQQAKPSLSDFNLLALNPSP